MEWTWLAVAMIIIVGRYILGIGGKRDRDGDG